MTRSWILATAIGLTSAAAQADVVPKGLTPDCAPCVFTTSSGARVTFDFSVTDEGFLNGVAFDGHWFPLQSFLTPDPMGPPPLVQVAFDHPTGRDIYAVTKNSGTRNRIRYYFLIDTDTIHLLGEAPDLRYDAEADVFEGSIGFGQGAEVSRYTIRDGKFVLLNVQQVTLGDE